MRSRNFALLVVTLLIVPNLGCRTWHGLRDTVYFYEPVDEAICSYNCSRLANSAWKTRFDRYCDRDSVDHFGAGFKAGYASVAMGGTGCAPPLPPRKYWGWWYQNCEGQKCVASWFDGYPAGARAAEEDGVANWSRMQTSYLIDAQYAARMPGSRKSGGPAPPGTPFPGEVMEEIPAANETVIPTPDSRYAPTEVTPEPASIDEEATVIRNLTPAISTSSKHESAVRQIEAQPEQTGAIRTFDAPAAEVLSGLAVPRKNATVVEAAPELDIATDEGATLAQEAVVTTDEASVEEPASNSASLIAESPAYSLGGDSEKALPATLPAPSSDEQDVSSVVEKVKKTLPPIIKSKPQKRVPPIVRPLDEQGRVTESAPASKTAQVSFESREETPEPVIRRIGMPTP